VAGMNIFKTLTISIARFVATAPEVYQSPPRRVDVLDGELAQTRDTQLTQAAEQGFGGARSSSKCAERLS
jgi:hypothetical protein